MTQLGSINERLVSAAAQTTIHAPEHIEFAGTTININEVPWAPESPQALTDRERMLHALALVLYYGVYCNDGELVLNMLPERSVYDGQFVESLSTANQTRRPSEAGWRIQHQSPDGTLHVCKAGRFRSARPGEYVLHQATGCAEALVTLPIEREHRDWLPMFYLAHSETLPNQCDDQDNVRFYLHCDQRNVASTIASITGCLNQFRTPFRLKCLNHPSLFTRPDSAVLYVEKRYFAHVARCLLGMVDDGTLSFAGGVPLWSRRIAPGIGIAEDPGNGQSFGQYRTRLLAEAMLDANDANRLHRRDVLSDVERVFANVGISIEMPHLGAGSVDCYTSQLPRASQ